MQRVADGGHDVPDEKIHARYPRTLANLRSAIPVADDVYLFDNSSLQDPHRLFAVYHGGEVAEVLPPVPAWAGRLPGLPGPGQADPTSPGGSGGTPPG